MSIFRKKNTEAADNKPQIRIKKSSKKKKITITVSLILVLVLIFFCSRGCSKEQTASVTVTTATVTRGDINTPLSGSGTIEANEQREITSLVKGDIVADYFEENDEVKKDQPLYLIDTSDMETNVKNARDDLNDAKEDYQDSLNDRAKLTVTAPFSGVISEVHISKNDDVNNGTQLVTIQDNTKMILSIEFNAADRNALYNGAPAEIYLEGSSTKYNGTVERVASGTVINKRGVSVIIVDIAVSGTNTITPGTTATAIVNGIACNSAGNFDYNEEKAVKAEIQGVISALYVKKGDSVKAGDTIATIKSDTLDDTIKARKRAVERAERTLENQQDTLDDYTIKSPIDGTVIYKNSKAGDKLDNTNAATSMAIIADMSVIKFTLAVDELDITKVALDQKATITADALEGHPFEGYVSEISSVGTTTNGVTTYPVTIIVDNPEGLIPGMNVEATIITQSAEDVLLMPTTALNRGNTVWVKENSKSAKNGKVVETNKNMPNAKLYEGYVQIQIETGLSNDNFIEITSGLAEGDEVLITTVVIDSSFDPTKMMPGGMGGGMNGGMGGGNMGRNSGDMRGAPGGGMR